MRIAKPVVVLMFLLVVCAQPVQAGTGALALNSTCPSHITLVGRGPVGADVTGNFVVIVRDLANNPLNGASVLLDLSQCLDITLCADQSDPFATVNCELKTVRKFTDELGRVSFTVLGASNGAGNAVTLAGNAVSQYGAARIYANGSSLRHTGVTASTIDLDGVGGVAINDLAVFLQDLGSGQPWGRSDFDADGAVGINDLAVWLGVYGAGTSTQGCTSSCP